MAKKLDHLQAPSLQLQGCIDELNKINGNLFSLKLGVYNLIEAVEGGNITHAKIIIETFQLKQVLQNLTADI